MPRRAQQNLVVSPLSPRGGPHRQLVSNPPRLMDLVKVKWSTGQLSSPVTRRRFARLTRRCSRRATGEPAATALLSLLGPLLWQARCLSTS